jgi:hypothetical protein
MGQARRCLLQMATRTEGSWTLIGTCGGTARKKSFKLMFLQGKRLSIFVFWGVDSPGAPQR